MPDTTPILTEDRKHFLFDRGLPGPFRGEWPERCLRYFEHWDAKCAAGWTFLGRPVLRERSAPYAGCDGVFTVAANLRGATQLCMDLLEDPDYAHQLLAYVGQALIARMKAWRGVLGIPVPQDGFSSADDSTELLSVDQYCEHVLPIHRQMYDTFGTNRKRAIHLCGDAQRHFRVLHDELGIAAFDTGFPIDFARLRRELGPDVLIHGGPPAALFVQDDPDAMTREVRRILESGVLDGGHFVLQEANNLPPTARLPVCEAFYNAGKTYGRVPR